MPTIVRHRTLLLSAFVGAAIDNVTKAIAVPANIFARTPNQFMFFISRPPLWYANASRVLGTELAQLWNIGGRELFRLR